MSQKKIITFIIFLIFSTPSLASMDGSLKSKAWDCVGIYMANYFLPSGESFFLAAFFAWFTQFNIQALTTGSLFLFPLMFLGIKMGYRVEDWFASGTINSIPFMIIIYYVCKLCNAKWYFK